MMLQNALSVALLTMVGGSAGFAAGPDIGADMNPAAAGLSAERADLTLENLDDWQAAIEPAGPALADLAIDWETTILAGVRRASAEGKPLMIYVMNGHPFGCT